jgi:hypothetical protein
MDNKQILSWLSANSIMFTLLAIFVAFLVYQLYLSTRDKNNPIHILDLVTENEKLSERKFARFGTWIITSWGFVYMIAACKLEDWYFYGYIGAWVSNALLAKYIPNNDTKSLSKEENA